MKLVSYQRDGGLRHGRLDGETITELGDGDLMDVVANGADSGTEVGTYSLADVQLTAPLLRPGKLLAAAANYQAHVREGGGKDLDKSRISPRLFLKPSTSISGPDAELAIPDITTQMDWEAELAVVIGQRCRHVPVDDALSVVFGYIASNDVSARSLELGWERDSDAAINYFDWLAGKWPDGFAPMGPYLVTADEIPDPQDLQLTLDLNGERWQESSTGAMIFNCAELIAFASRVMTLEPGDVIMTGTPAGTGAASDRYLQAGDVMTVTVEKLGSLTTRIV